MEFPVLVRNIENFVMKKVVSASISIAKQWTTGFRFWIIAFVDDNRINEDNNFDDNSNNKINNNYNTNKTTTTKSETEKKATTA